MIALDTNLLVYAHRADNPFHAAIAHGVGRTRFQPFPRSAHPQPAGVTQERRPHVLPLRTGCVVQRKRRRRRISARIPWRARTRLSKRSRRDDGTRNIYLIDKPNSHDNRLQMINQYEVEGVRVNRYDVTVLVKAAWTG